MKVLRGCGAVAHLQIVFRAELQEPLYASAGVLWSLSFVAVRQQQNEPGWLPPLGFSRREKLVDDDLRAVDEVAELSFPQDQRFRLAK